MNKSGDLLDRTMVARWLWSNLMILCVWPYKIEGPWLRYATLSSIICHLATLDRATPMTDQLMREEGGNGQLVYCWDM